VSAPEPGHAGQEDAPSRGADEERLAAVRRVGTTAVGSLALQRLTALAARLVRAPSAQVSLIGEQQVIAGGVGLPAGSLGACSPLAESLCTVAVEGSPAPLVVTDASTDPRVAHLPPVTSGAVRSYVGIPLRGSAGHVVGALAVFGPRPRPWTDAEVTVLSQLAASVATELELSALAREFEAHRLRSELAIDAAEIGSFDWDLTTGRLIWDDRLVELFGYQREVFDETIEAFNARLHPDDLPRVADALQGAIDTVGSYEAEYRVLLPTGETRWIYARGRALADDRGTAVRLLGAAYDATVQRHGDARVARVLEAMNAAFFALDRQWRFTYVNAEAERLLQRSRAELLGGVIWELFPAAPGSDFEEHYRGAVASGEERVFEAYYPAPLDAWYEARVWPSPDGLSVHFLDISERRAAEQRARASGARLALIADVTATLSRTMGPGEAEDLALQHVAEAVVPLLGDWVVASLVDEEGRIRDVGSWHVVPPLREAAQRYTVLRLASLDSSAPFPTALRTGRVLEVENLRPTVAHVLHGEIGELFDLLAPRSCVVLPLTARGRTLGALSVYRGHDRAPMDAEEVAAAREVADRTALALDNSRLYEQQRRVAETLQRSMLTAPPEPDHAEIVVRYHPAVEAAEVGGDWYDAFLAPGGATVLIIGDVVGHDIAAAAAMGQLRGLFRGIAYREDAGPAEVLTALDAAIEGLQLGTMATAAIARIEQTPKERAAGITRLRWSNAGHPPPLVLHPDGRIDALAEERAQLMLGVDPAAKRSESTLTVARGATVLLYTDGLVEGRDLPLDEGMAQLRAALAELADRPLAELCDELIARLRPGGLQDDVALVALRLHPQDRPRPPSAGPRRVPPSVPPAV
jgi:serine phosphatase RsbU (regulator of sigma subunit)/PAS domain-containing protein